MQQDASNAKQLIAERVRQSTNILVAVSANPSVDALAAALALALMLNKMDKHATAVFSGTMPPAMEFLEPGKTFENSVDSLRDFIISLDKEKADRLRYKVEDDVVRIFITPYRTIISEKDLQFSQGDFNVDLIIALGVEKREDLDKAIVAHGRILHDATVMTINTQSQQSSLGVVDWHEPAASSLCEMLVSLAESFQQPNLLDQQIATSLLTGIVAATDRFSNHNTSPRVMTMSAQLMAAGANQQLIANNLVKAHELPKSLAGQLVPGAGSVKVDEKPKKDGELDIEHPKKPAGTQTPAQQPSADAQKNNQKQGQPNKKGGKDNRDNKKPQTAEDELSAALPSAAAATSAFDELKNAIENESSGKKEEPVPAAVNEPKAPGSQSVNGGSDEPGGTDKTDDGFVVGNSSWRGRRLEPPVLGGTLNATTERAMDESHKSQEEDRNQKLLTHPESAVEEPKQPQKETPKPKESSKIEVKDEPAPPSSPPPLPPEISSPPIITASELQPPEVPAPPMAVPPEPAPAQAEVSPPPLPDQAPADAVIHEAAAAAKPATAAGADLNAARQAVSDALASQPFDPAGQPLQSVGALPLEQTNPVPPAVEMPSSTPPETISAPPTQSAGNGLPPLPPMPPLPQQDDNQPVMPPSLNDLPPLPNDIPPASVVPPPEAPAPETPQGPADPRQFKIPGA